jgi:hypothetical protein
MNCCIEGCNRRIKARGMCQLHYRRVSEGRSLDSTRVRWTPAEDAVLVEHYRALGPSGIEASGLLPGRDRKAIAGRAGNLGLQQVRGGPAEDVVVVMPPWGRYAGALPAQLVPALGLAA